MPRKRKETPPPTLPVLAPRALPSRVPPDELKGALEQRVRSFRFRALRLAETTLDITEEAQGSAGEALAVLKSIANSDRSSDANRIKAACAILDRAIGKAPTGSAEGGGNLPDPNSMSDDEIEQQMLAALMDRYSPEEIAAKLAKFAGGGEDDE